MLTFFFQFPISISISVSHHPWWFFFQIDCSCCNLSRILMFLMWWLLWWWWIHYLSPVSSDPGGRVPAVGSVWTGCGLWNRRWPTLPGLSPHHLPRDQSQEPILRPVPTLAHEWSVWDCRHLGGHCRDNGWVASFAPISISLGTKSGLTQLFIYSVYLSHFFLLVFM